MTEFDMEYGDEKGSIASWRPIFKVAQHLHSPRRLLPAQHLFEVLVHSGPEQVRIALVVL
jgi:hypothetical protein